ncbi:MAG: lysophospholipid transporter LplT [Gammaproteobacteria bacterium]|nr:lysophospholipid transporter LplT [Gammaproteobacteria bacterium]
MPVLTINPALIMSYPLFSRPVISLLIAQFLSALADNAIFIAAIALLKIQGHLGWISLLQISFLLAYIILAPYVGVFADGHTKNKVMFLANSLKLLGGLSMLLMPYPLLSYCIIGIGAASYSPAKYGILPELVSQDKLIRANGLIESSTIIAIIIGVVIGGIISDHSTHLLIIACSAVYLLSALMTVLIPSIPAKLHFSWRNVWLYTCEYFSDTAILWRDSSSRFAIIGTSTFWSVGATLRLLLFAWIPLAFLNTGNELPANLMGVLSIGLAIGALTVGLWIHLGTVRRVIWPALFLGPLIIATLLAHSIIHLGLIMILIGFCGGLFIIPLNALLQHRGTILIGTGRSLAVQNFIENASMLTLITVYGLAQSYHLPMQWIISALGLLTFMAILLLGCKTPQPQGWG